MRKVVKYLLALIGVGAAAGALYAYFSKKNYDDSEELEFENEEDDFDLDSDLEPVGSREYVSLNPSKSSDEDQEVTEEIIEKND